MRPVAGGVYGVPVPAAARAIAALGLGICGLRFLMIPSQACSKLSRNVKNRSERGNLNGTREIGVVEGAFVCFEGA